MEITEGKRKIAVHIDEAKFRRYEESLKRMSSEKIIFDIIQDDDDIRETYFIDGNPAEFRSYLLLTLQWVVDSFVSSEQKKIKELENRVLELHSELSEKNTLLALAKEKESSLENKIEQSRKKLDSAEWKVDHLQELLSRYMEEEGMEESESNDIRENSKLRMHYLYKLGLLDDGIWNEGIPQKVRAQVIGAILDAGPLKSDTAIRYYKFFNSYGSPELKEYDSKNEQTFFDYMRKNCPNLRLEKGQFINRLRKL
ncbi:hypothetical protein [Sphingobacterium puteale]|uniref:hypothetical protein n=1 Tax=Sphingobacterium puteale TaxID=2420510 RepID=UPI003D9884C0